MVLYFGDHVYSDLVDASFQHGWHTVSISKHDYNNKMFTFFILSKTTGCNHS